MASPLTSYCGDCGMAWACGCIAGSPITRRVGTPMFRRTLNSIVPCILAVGWAPSTLWRSDGYSSRCPICNTSVWHWRNWQASMAETAEPKLQSQKSAVNLWGLLLKALVFFAIFNAVYYVTQPLAWLNHLTVYNALVPGRTRLPFSEYPDASYSLIMTNIDQMLASHQIATAKAPDEFRVVMIRDSSVWGYLLPPTQTQAECLNGLGLTLPSGRKVHVYNLGDPTLTLPKAFLFL